MTVTSKVDGGNGQVSPESFEVALDSSVTFTITPDTGYAVDTISYLGTTYTNNGVSTPPENSSWVEVTIDKVSKAFELVVTFDVCESNDGVPDKYKKTVTAKSGRGGKVSPKNQKVVKGKDATVNIEPDDNMAVDTITDGDTTYVNDGTKSE